MDIKFCGSGFVINNKDHKQFFDSQKELNKDDMEWEMALGVLFKEVVFHSEHKINNTGLNKSLIYYPLKRKTYILNQNKLDFFINKYFQNFKLIDRKPELFSFQIPFPEMIYFNENSKIKHDDRYNIYIGRYKSETYKNIENYTLRINPRSISDFDPIFQKDFLSVYNLAEGYKEYIKLIMDIEPSNINIHNLIKPYYMLDDNELNKLMEIEKDIINDFHEESMRENNEKMDEQYSKWFDSEMDNLNRQAFENDPDNYWNID